jgi:hypothetical protein
VVLLMSNEAADAMGLARDRRTYWLGGGYAEEKSWFASEEAAPRRGFVVGRTASGQRFVANTPDDRTLL